MCLLLRNLVAVFRLRMTVGQWPTTLRCMERSRTLNKEPPVKTARSWRGGFLRLSPSLRRAGAGRAVQTGETCVYVGELRSAPAARVVSAAASPPLVPANSVQAAVPSLMRTWRPSPLICHLPSAHGEGTNRNCAMSAAGWYPDPSGSGGQRYFDGTNWGPTAPSPSPSQRDLAQSSPPQGSAATLPPFTTGSSLTGDFLAAGYRNSGVLWFASSSQRRCRAWVHSRKWTGANAAGGIMSFFGVGWAVLGRHVDDHLDCFRHPAHAAESSPS